jgi:hypothetical protein
LLHFARRAPVVGRAGIAFGKAANESAVFDTRDIVGSLRARKLLGRRSGIEGA